MDSELPITIETTLPLLLLVELPTTIETTLPLLLLVATPRRLPTDSSPLATTTLKSSLSDDGGIMQKKARCVSTGCHYIHFFSRC